mgnify:FL=1
MIAPVDRCARYIDAVITGEILACRYVKLACERQVRDLGRAGDDDFPYFFDETKGNRVCLFIEGLSHIKGKWAGSLIALEDWQCFVLCVAFGWVNEEGNRRYRTTYGEVPRKNAKSTLTSGVGLYMLAADNEGGAECYSAATTRDQAKIVWQDAWRMAKGAKWLQQPKYGVETSARSIYCEKSSSLFQPLSSEGNSLDGLNIHFAGVDELHAHKTREVFDVLETGTGARAQSMLWLITTSGFNLAGICYEQREYLVKILEGVAVDETYFGFIYTIDEGDDWADPATHQKANPNWGVSVFPDDVARLCRKAMEMPSAQNNFLTKRLNVWCNADTAWMNMTKWHAAADRTLDIDDFIGQPCKLGLDLASKTDIAAKAYLFERDGHYYYFGEYYLPEETIENGNNASYKGWLIDGHLTETFGAVIDHAEIKQGIIDDHSRFDVQEVSFDPWNATMLSSALMDEGCVMVEIRATVQNFSEPMKWLEALILDGRFHHTGCPLMTWMVSNIVAHTDKKDNIYPNKARPENKIDGVIALLMALNRYINIENENSLNNAYAERGIRTL